MLKLGLILIITTGIICTPTPPIWGGNPTFQVAINISGSKVPQPYNMLYQYDSTTMSSKYINILPQYDGKIIKYYQTIEVCSQWSEVPSSYLHDNCTLTFSYDKWLYINYPSDNWCCKCMEVGIVVPDWLKNDSSFKGELNINGKKCNWWAKNGYELNNYCSEVGTDLPVRYWESLNGSGPTVAQWDFMLDTYKIENYQLSNFAPPSNCDTLCQGTCAEFRNMTITKEE